MHCAKTHISRIVNVSLIKIVKKFTGIFIEIKILFKIKLYSCEAPSKGLVLVCVSPMSLCVSVVLACVVDVCQCSVG